MQLSILIREISLGNGWQVMQKFTTDLKDANECQWSSHPQTEYSTSVSLPHQAQVHWRGRRQIVKAIDQRGSEKNSIFQTPQDPTLCMSSHRPLCLPAEVLQKSKPVNIPAWMVERLLSPNPKLRRYTQRMASRVRESVFFKDVVPSRLTTLQRMGPHSWVCVQHKVDSAGY